MENPMSWGLAEHVVAEALIDAETARVNGVIGLSTVRIITDALRAEELLRDEGEALAKKYVAKDQTLTSNDISRGQQVYRLLQETDQETE